MRYAIFRCFLKMIFPSAYITHSFIHENAGGDDYWESQFEGSRTFQVCTKCLLNVFRAMTEDVYLQ